MRGRRHASSVSTSWARRRRSPGRRRARDAARLRAGGRGRAGPLGRRRAAGRPHRPALDRPLDRRNGTGRLAIAAASRDGATVVVDDDRIADATRELARTGLYVETSSALALAGVRQARRDGVIADGALAVAAPTANGRGLSENEPGLFDVAFADDVDALLRAIST